MCVQINSGIALLRKTLFLKQALKILFEKKIMCVWSSQAKLCLVKICIYKKHIFLLKMTWHKIGPRKNYHIWISYTTGQGVSNDNDNDNEWQWQWNDFYCHEVTLFPFSIQNNTHVTNTTFSHAQEASTVYTVLRKIGNIPSWQWGQEAVAYGP